MFCGINNIYAQMPQPQPSNMQQHYKLYAQMVMTQYDMDSVTKITYVTISDKSGQIVPTMTNAQKASDTKGYLFISYKMLQAAIDLSNDANNELLNAQCQRSNATFKFNNGDYTGCISSIGEARMSLDRAMSKAVQATYAYLEHIKMYKSYLDNGGVP